MKKPILLYAFLVLLTAFYIACGSDDGTTPPTDDGSGITDDDPSTDDDPKVNPPTIAKFEPTQGTPGIKVTISGSNFSSTIENNTVEFNGTSATINEASSTSLKVVVPNNAESGPISVTVDGETVESSTDFDVLEPQVSIDSFNPLEGKEGTVVEISGTNFSTNLEENLVEFNGVPAQVTEATETMITVTVPADATTGLIGITVGGVDYMASDMDFTVGPWRKMATLPENEYNSIEYGNMAFLRDAEGKHKIYFGLGQTTSGQNTLYLKDIWVYDVASDSWSEGPEFPGKGRYKATSFEMSNIWFIITGENGEGAISDSWVFNPKTETWTEFDSTNLGSDLSSFTIDHGETTLGYVYGVLDNGEPQDLKGIDKQGNILDYKGFAENGQGLQNAVGFSLSNDLGYIATGNGNDLSNGLYIYDPDLDSWTDPGTPLPGSAREGAIGFDIQGFKGYVGLGVSVGGHLNDLWEYDPDMGWTQKTSLPSFGREGAAATSIGNQAYIGFGAGVGGAPEQFKEFWKYNPALED